MSRDNNILLRARIDDDGRIAGFFLGHYSGGDCFVLRILSLARGDQYWVADLNGYGYTIFIAPSEGNLWKSIPCRKQGDLDELAANILREWREGILHRRDQAVRDLIRRLDSRLGPAKDIPPLRLTPEEMKGIRDYPAAAKVPFILDDASP